MDGGPVGLSTPGFLTAWWGLQVEAVFSWIPDLGDLPKPPAMSKGHHRAS